MRLIWFSLLLLAFTADAETRFEIGANFASGEFTKSATFIVQERFGKYGLSFGYIGSQTIEGCGNHPRREACIFPSQEQFIVGAERIFNLFGQVNFRLGPYWFSGVNRISSARLNGRLALEYDFGRMSVMLSHFSNGGTGDVIEIENPPGTVHKGRFNMGLDGIFVTGKF